MIHPLWSFGCPTGHTISLFIASLPGEGKKESKGYILSRQNQAGSSEQSWRTSWSRGASQKAQAAGRVAEKQEAAGKERWCDQGGGRQGSPCCINIFGHITLLKIFQRFPSSLRGSPAHSEKNQRALTSCSPPILFSHTGLLPGPQAHVP